MKSICLALLLCFITSFCAVAEKLAAYDDIPLHWRTEIIPFPLHFAPQIKLRGVEELVFAPGMYQPKRADFFSYAFTWIIKPTEIDESLMHTYLRQYYQGLYQAVAKDNPRSDMVKVTISEAKTDRFYRGHIDWVEPFVSHQPQTLYFQASKTHCSNSKQTRWHFMVSPQPKSHAVWTDLNALTLAQC
ncbi:hypothetical protein ACFOD0_15595 [Shewanella intestini]|uniref:Secreted protein n=1 Tax=Shewanella intestini TaxID=2017544 RepID=A0ABS5I4Y3_9GAMM|nr:MULTISPECIES: hypothetical protein [Shewanella]MBR9729087.1 hypothetical protein [Shewanella intestini]MRG37163.1 hypothetical protein [Shewanella sp. XMDDZSB0408]